MRYSYYSGYFIQVTQMSIFQTNLASFINLVLCIFSLLFTFVRKKKTRQSTYTTIWESIYHPIVNILLSQKSGLMLRKINHPLIIMPAMKGIIEGGGNTKMNKE